MVAKVCNNDIIFGINKSSACQFRVFFYHMYRGWILTRKAAKQALSGESKASITSKVQLQWTEQT
jgi:hypothetical protein